jgi:hypothetical protein
MPKTVKRFQDALTTTFLERTALLLASTSGVVGGTGMHFHSYMHPLSVLVYAFGILTNASALQDLQMET